MALIRSQFKEAPYPLSIFFLRSFWGTLQLWIIKLFRFIIIIISVIRAGFSRTQFYTFIWRIWVEVEDDSLLNPIPILNESILYSWKMKENNVILLKLIWGKEVLVPAVTCFQWIPNQSTQLRKSAVDTLSLVRLELLHDLCVTRS